MPLLGISLPPRAVGGPCPLESLTVRATQPLEGCPQVPPPRRSVAWLLGGSVWGSYIFSWAVAVGPLGLHLHRSWRSQGRPGLPSSTAAEFDLAGPAQSTSRGEVCGGG